MRALAAADPHARDDDGNPDRRTRRLRAAPSRVGHAAENPGRQNYFPRRSTGEILGLVDLGDSRHPSWYAPPPARSSGTDLVGAERASPRAPCESQWLRLCSPESPQRPQQAEFGLPPQGCPQRRPPGLSGVAERGSAKGRAMGHPRGSALNLADTAPSVTVLGPPLSVPPSEAGDAARIRVPTCWRDGRRIRWIRWKRRGRCVGIASGRCVCSGAPLTQQ